MRVMRKMRGMRTVWVGGRVVIWFWKFWMGTEVGEVIVVEAKWWVRAELSLEWR
jgi:hypothetical protein